MAGFLGRKGWERKVSNKEWVVSARSNFGRWVGFYPAGDLISTDQVIPD